MMARVRGRRMVMVLPFPAVLDISAVPRKRSMLRRTTSRPTPRPERSVEKLLNKRNLNKEEIFEGLNFKK